MGLLIFQERTEDDKSPFRRNEYHVGKHCSNSAIRKVRPSQDSRPARIRASPIPRNETRAPRATLRRERARSSWEQQSSIPSGRYRQMIEFLALRDEEMDSIRDSATTTSDRPTDQSNSDMDDLTDRGPSAMSQEEYERMEEAYREAGIPFHHHDFRASATRTGQNTTTNFAPARRYYEDLEREQYFDVMPARGRAQSSRSRAGSSGRVASPDTQQAILDQIENQADTETRPRLYMQVVSETQTSPPRMTISQADGLGDRHRSPSQNGDEPQSDAEENWTSLMETIPTYDENLPSASSSFASDSASSILSRSRPRSSLTNPTNTDSRASSTDIARTAEYLSNCPEADEPDMLSVSRPPRRTSSLAPVRYSSASVSNDRQSRSAIAPLLPNQIQRREFGRLLGTSSDGLDSLDDLMDMISDGRDVPAEMWAAVGITPHLALRGGAARLRRRNQML